MGAVIVCFKFRIGVRVSDTMFADAFKDSAVMAVVETQRAHVVFRGVVERAGGSADLGGVDVGDEFIPG